MKVASMDATSAFECSMIAMFDYLRQTMPDEYAKLFGRGEFVVADVGSGARMPYHTGMLSLASKISPNYKVIAIDPRLNIDDMKDIEAEHQGHFFYVKDRVESAAEALQIKGISKADLVTMINPEFFISKAAIERLVTSSGPYSLLSRGFKLTEKTRNENPLPNPLTLGEIASSSLLIAMLDGESSYDAFSEEIKEVGYKIIAKLVNPFSEVLKKSYVHRFTPIIAAVPTEAVQ